MSARPARRQRGLTLIELMVALAIFAVLGVLSHRALAEVSTSRTRLEEGFERWRSVGRAMQRIDADLLQVVAPAAEACSQPATGPRPAHRCSSPVPPAAGPSCSCCASTRPAACVPGRLPPGRRRLDWLRWSGRDAFGEPLIEPLLGNVREVRWRFLTGGNLVDAWPPASAAAPCPTR